MSTIHQQYEIVIDPEVHAQLLTHSKLFCGDSSAFGAMLNTNVSAITLGHPGTLPKMNRQAINHATKMGLACNCQIEKKNYFARKNYFYPDLPKGYQISQHTTPICKNGFVGIETPEGEKKIRLNRIHLEEDAGKSLHDVNVQNTAINYNRAGTPLIGIVTEPDLRSSDQAFTYVTELRKLVRYLDVCDGNMEEGSMRCDANISVRKKGEQALGTKVEVKNLNSIRSVKQAIDYEAQMLIHLLETGQAIKQQTRSFDAANGTTFAIQDEEDAENYRHFPDPDLTPFDLTDELINQIKASIPTLPAARAKKCTSQYLLSENDAQVLTEEKELSDYYGSVLQFSKQHKAVANWMLGSVKSWLNETGNAITYFPLTPAQIAILVTCVDDGLLSFSTVSTKLLQLLLQNPTADAVILAQKNNLTQQSDAAALEPLIDEVLQQLANKVEEYKKRGGGEDYWHCLWHR